MKFESGKRYAIVGKNGSGKTTLIKLLLGLYKPDKGSIYFNGANASGISFAERMSYFSVAFQDSEIFESSIKYNVALAHDGIDDAKVAAMLELTSLLNDVQDMPEGLETRIGMLYENSRDISGGQRQKLAISRALFAENQVLILDEPTASLDPIAESNLYHLLCDSTKKYKTSIFITHRLGATAQMDCICVLDNGSFVEVGSHKSLMEHGGLYSQMYAKQRGMYV